MPETRVQPMDRSNDLVPAPSYLPAPGRSSQANRQWIPILTTALAGLLSTGSMVQAQTHATARVSVQSGGTQANGSSNAPSVSGDGRYVAFTSSATNLVDADTNAVSDVFVEDRLTHVISRVSVANDGAQANGASFKGVGPCISDDGRYVAFVSSATNLVLNDTNGQADAFVHDRDTGQTTRVNLDTNGQPLAPASLPSISGNGLVVSFVSGGQVFARDRLANQTSMVSVTVNGPIGGTDSALNTDGRLVVFDGGRPIGAYGVYVHDRVAGTTAFVSIMPAPLQLLNASNFWPTISADGRYVAFNAGVSDPRNPFADRIDVWVRDRDVDADGILDEADAAVTRLVNESAAGVRANDDIGRGWPRISKSGRFVVFSSYADNLLGPGGDTNGLADVFVVDLDGDADSVFFEPGDRRVWRASVASDGTPQSEADASSRIADISDDGRVVAFESAAANLVPQDTNDTTDVFAFDRFAWKIDDLLAPDTGAPSPQISGNGDWVAFASDAATLVSGDTNGQVDVFVRDRRRGPGQPGAVVRVSLATAGGQALGGASDQPSISGDGRFVVFRSAASNLVPRDTNGLTDIFLHDRDVDRDGVFDEPGARATIRVNVTGGGAQATGGASGSPRISPDARWIVFSSSAVNLTPGAAGVVEQVYLKERLTGAVSCISERNGVKANADAVTPVVGNYGAVAFATVASNLAPSDVNGSSDVYLSELFPSGRVLKLASGQSGASVPGASTSPSMSTDGLVLAFASNALGCAGAPAGLTHVFVMPLHQPQAYFCASRSREGVIGNGPSGSPSLANQGSGGYYHLTITSTASNLIFADTNAVNDVFYVRFYPFEQIRVPPYYPEGFITDLGHPRQPRPGRRAAGDGERCLVAVNRRHARRVRAARGRAATLSLSRRGRRGAGGQIDRCGPGPDPDRQRPRSARGTRVGRDHHHHRRRRARVTGSGAAARRCPTAGSPARAGLHPRPHAAWNRRAPAGIGPGGDRPWQGDDLARLPLRGRRALRRDRVAGRRRGAGCGRHRATPRHRSGRLRVGRRRRR